MNRQCCLFAVAWLVLGLGFGLAQPLGLQPPAGAFGGGFGGVRIDRAAVERNRTLTLVLDPAVAAELKLTVEQLALLKKLPDDVLAKNKDAIAKAVDDDRLAWDKYVAEAPARAKDEEKRLDDMLAKHLTDAQRKRGRQLELQSMSMYAFLDEAVAKELKLTDAQKAAAMNGVIALSSELNSLPGAPPGFGRGGFADPDPKVLDARRAAARKAVTAFVATLTPEKAGVWAGLIGTPSDKVLILIPPPLGTSFRSMFWSELEPRARMRPVTKASFPAWTEELKLSEGKLTEIRNDLSAAQLRTSFSTSGITAQLGLRNRIEVELVVAAEKVLNPEQVIRLEQVRKQMKGINLFEDATLLNEMNFTPAQNAVIEKATSEAIQKLIAANPNDFVSNGLVSFDAVTGSFGTEVFARREKIKASYFAAVTAEFDDSQTKVLDRALGKSFDVSKCGMTAANPGPPPLLYLPP